MDACILSKKRGSDQLKTDTKSNGEIRLTGTDIKLVTVDLTDNETSLLFSLLLALSSRFKFSFYFCHKVVN